MEPLHDIAVLLPPNYVRIVIIGLALLKLLDEIVRLIPDKWISGHTTVEAIVEGIKRLAARLATFKLPKGPAVLVVLLLPSIAFADTPAAEVRPLPPDPVAPAPAVPNVALLPDCISQGAANAALACVTGKAPPPTDRKTFWITWGTSMGSTVATAALAWVVNHYALNPDPVK